MSAHHRITAVLGALALAVPAMLVASPALAADLVETEPNDHPTLADALPLGVTMRAKASGTSSNDRDFFDTTLPYDSRVTLDLRFPAGLVGGAYAVTLSAGNGRTLGTWTLEGSDSAGAWGSAQTIFAPAGKVTVLVEAKSTDAVWDKEYSLRVDATPGFVETEPNDHWTTADVLPLATVVRGSAYGTWWTDLDHYVSTVPQDSRVVPRLEFPAGLVGGAYTVSLYDRDNRLRGSWALEGGDHTGAWSSEYAVFVPAGKVYVVVEAKSTDAVWGKEYSLRVDATPGFVETEPNDHWTTADSLPLSTTLRGSTYGTSANDRDWTVTRLAAPTRVRLGLTFPTGLSGAAYDVTVYDGSRRVVWTRSLTGADASGAWASGAIVAAGAGDLYVEVGASSTAVVWGTEYSLRVDPVVTAARPRISGSAKVGKVLTAVPGAWTSGTTFSYQWFRSGAAITGATARTYKAVTADAGRALTVRVTGARTGYVGAAATSPAMTVARFTPKVSASKPSVRRSARATVKVVVRAPATSRPTGTVTVKVAGRTVKVKIAAKSQGKVSVRLPKITKRGTYKAKVTFSPSGSTKVSTNARTVTTTVRVR